MVWLIDGQDLGGQISNNNSTGNGVKSGQFWENKANVVLLIIKALFHF